VIVVTVAEISLAEERVGRDGTESADLPRAVARFRRAGAKLGLGPRIIAGEPDEPVFETIFDAAGDAVVADLIGISRAIRIGGRLLASDVMHRPTGSFTNHQSLITVLNVPHR